MTSYVTKERIYRTDDDRLVPEGHEDGAFLFAGVNAEVQDTDLKQFDASAVKRLLKRSDGSPLVEDESPSVRDEPTINPRQSPDVHAPSFEARSSASDKVIADEESGLTARLQGAPVDAGAVTDQDLIDAGQDKPKRKR